MLGRGEVYVITSVVKSKKLVVRAKSSKSGAVALDVPVIEQMVGGNLKVSAAVGQQSAIQYEGAVPLVFGFQAVRLRFKNATYDSFERLAPGAAAARSLDSQPTGVGPNGLFEDLSGTDGRVFARVATEGTGSPGLTDRDQRVPEDAVLRAAARLRQRRRADG